RAQTDFKRFSAYDLGRLAIAGLINKTKLDGSHIDHVYYGNVIQDINTSNVARESSMAAGLPDSIPATTLSM
ncbi:acetyl-CoA C-acyltransferase, partial [Candidatus Saccharibacteria bacterium]|nr:acetyl-CoA C-acyltransferase [Candidatus Saccharibacteria bacterium]NIV04018.1 acetyl-CoA C-acyltransferase [Calditrichia bacterium]NIV73106.1 acetyl-CoA C-acyltransferase [Calditrichia bacterium]NIV99438.1 acetyl-CoA C-acyltransferase [Candidatus Saccharibacteria bacterium]